MLFSAELSKVSAKICCWDKQIFKEIRKETTQYIAFNSKFIHKHLECAVGILESLLCFSSLYNSNKKWDIVVTSSISRNRLYKHLLLTLAGKRAFIRNLQYSESKHVFHYCCGFFVSEDFSWVGGLSTWHKTHLHSHWWQNVDTSGLDHLRIWLERSDLKCILNALSVHSYLYLELSTFVWISQVGW